MEKRLLHGIYVSLSLSLFLIFLYSINLFGSWQNRLSDALFQTRPPHKDIVIIAIDNDSINQIGRWPWDRSVHAKLLNILQSNKPAVVGFDVSFFEQSNFTSDSQLASAVKNSGGVILAAEVEEGKLLKPIPALLTNSDFGVVNTLSDADGVTRRVETSFKTNEGEVDSFALKILKGYGLDLKKLENLPSVNGFLNINFIGKPKSFIYLPFIEVLNGEVNPEVFKDKIVLIGATAPDLHDDQIVPTSAGSPMPGIEIHANIIQTILEEKYLLSEPKAITVATILIVTTILSLLLINVGVYKGIAIFLAFLAAYIFYTLRSFDNGTIRNLIYPPLGMILATVSNIGYKYFSEYRQKQFIKKAFGHYLSGSVLKEILDDPNKLKLGGQRREITVLFSDVASFTTISEALEPETLANLLNLYLSRMTQTVFKYNGVLDKYIGDAVMAFWGAPIPEPDHALAACKVALEMYEEIKNFRDEIPKLAPKAKEVPELKNFDVRIGINTGDMVVGNMGSDARFDYTLLGDNVNLGSRLEGINKQYGTNIIISEATFSRVTNHVIARKLDRVAVKGKKKGVSIYELRGLGKPKKDEEKFIRNFGNAWEIYEKGEFKAALQSFKSLAKKHPNDGPIKVYIDRCQKLISEKPKSWDGVYRAESK